MAKQSCSLRGDQKKLKEKEKRIPEISSALQSYKPH
jgi:hypothetical protein